LSAPESSIIIIIYSHKNKTCNIMLINDEVFVGAVVKHYPAIEVVSSVPDAIKKTLNLFELVRTDCDV